MIESRGDIPKKFSKVDKSFINRLYEGKGYDSLSSFSVFPKKLNFYGQDPGEEVVLVVRVHWIAYIPNIIFVLLFLLIPFLLLLFSEVLSFLGPFNFFLGLFVVGMLLSLNMFVSTILRWYYTVTIITDQRIVIVKMENAIHHSYAETQLEKIQDVTHTHLGFISNFFDVGNVDIDTAGHGVDFRLRTLPRPRELQDVINDLLEIKQKGDI